MLERKNGADGNLVDTAAPDPPTNPNHLESLANFRIVEFRSMHHGRPPARQVAAYAWRLFQSGEFTVSVGQALRQLAANPRLTHRRTRHSIAWTLLRAGEEPVCDGIPWAVAVACDIGALPAPLQQCWWALLDANPHLFNSESRLTRKVQHLLAALPEAEFEHRFDAWTRVLSTSLTPDLRCGGVTLLNWLLLLAAALPQSRLDEAMYRIAQSDWPHDPQSAARFDSDPAGWLPAYLATLDSRPPTSALACLEALSLHPATATLPEVHQLNSDPAKRTLHAAASSALG